MVPDYPIRVLCVFSTLDRGGAESMCMNLYRHIDREKIQFDFVKHTPAKGAFEDEIISLGGRIYETPRFTLKNAMKYYNWWKKHLVAHQEHQIIHGHFFGISPIYFRIAKQKGRITVGHIHIDRPDRPIKALFARFISGVTDYPFACSKPAGSWVYRKRPFTVLNNAIEADRFRADSSVAKAVREEFSLGESLVLGNVSRFNLQKNPHGTLEIFRLVHEKRPASKLLWIGDGPMRQEVTDKAKEYGVLDDVVFTGVRKDVERLLQAMDAFVFPSFYEGLPVSAIEAQAAGLPCFISDKVTKEVDVTGLCHFLPIDGSEDWAEKWADAILQDKTVRQDTSEQIIAAGYDIQTTAKWLEEFYLSIYKE